VFRQARSRMCVVNAARRSASRRTSSRTVESTPDSSRSPAARAPGRSSATSIFDATWTPSITLNLTLNDIAALGLPVFGTGYPVAINRFRYPCPYPVYFFNITSQSRDCGSRGVTTAAPFTLTLFRRGRIIHGATYFDDAGQRSPYSPRRRHSPSSCNAITARNSWRTANAGRVNNRPSRACC